MSIVPAQPGADAPAGARTRILGLQTRSSNRLRYWCVFLLNSLSDYSRFLECNNGTQLMSTRRASMLRRRAGAGYPVRLDGLVERIVRLEVRRPGVLDAA